LAILVLIGSGWRIYNASPIFPFSFPDSITLGGDVEASLARHNDPGVASALEWHFAAMWVLAAGYLLYVLWGAASGHFRRDFLPVGPKAFLRDFLAAATLRLEHRLGTYNAVQKVFYWGALALIALMLLSGTAIWKPVQTYPLELLFGGFPLLIQGEARSGLLYRTDVRAHPELRVVRAVEDPPPMLFAAAVTRLARRPNPVAFLRFLGTPQAAAVLSDRGLEALS
jgi:hypothetical protein